MLSVLTKRKKKAKGQKETFGNKAMLPGNDACML